MNRMESFVNMNQEANTRQNCKSGIQISIYLKCNVMHSNHPFKFGNARISLCIYRTHLEPLSRAQPLTR